MTRAAGGHVQVFVPYSGLLLRAMRAGDEVTLQQ